MPGGGSEGSAPGTGDRDMRYRNNQGSGDHAALARAGSASAIRSTMPNDTKPACALERRCRFDRMNVRGGSTMAFGRRCGSGPGQGGCRSQPRLDCRQLALEEHIKVSSRVRRSQISREHVQRAIIFASPRHRPQRSRLRQRRPSRTVAQALAQPAWRRPPCVRAPGG